ncbi:hypothetical protein CKA34_33380 (plasmid) [Rhizobium sp. 11515TR]|nr:hypothetical protein CKA34_33380 [Rhizobium sp. 11515TR]
MPPQKPPKEAGRGIMLMHLKTDFLSLQTGRPRQATVSATKVPPEPRFVRFTEQRAKRAELIRRQLRMTLPYLCQMAPAC